MTQPGAPEPVHAQQTATAPGMIVVSDPKASTPKLAVLVGAGTIQVYDLTKAAAPVRVGALKTPSGRATRATLHGSHAFVADFREGLQVATSLMRSSSSGLLQKRRANSRTRKC